MVNDIGFSSPMDKRLGNFLKLSIFFFPEQSKIKSVAKNAITPNKSNLVTMNKPGSL
jgi:hypothetical protein